MQTLSHRKKKNVCTKKTKPDIINYHPSIKERQIGKCETIEARFTEISLFSRLCLHVYLIPMLK